MAEVAKTEDKAMREARDAIARRPPRRRRAVWAALAAAGWMVAFALVHLYWALGGGAGLPTGFVMRDHPTLLLVDIIAIPLCIAGALLALALVAATGDGVRAVLLSAIWVTAAGLTAHALPSVIEVIDRFRAGGLGDLTERERLSLFLYEPYWLLGGMLFGAAGWLNRRHRRG